MKHRVVSLLVILALALLAAPPAVEAQQAGKVHRIGFLSTSNPQMAHRPLQVFLRRLKELGWVEGQNLLFEWRWAEGNLERLPALAGELVDLNPDLIIGVQREAALAVKKLTQTIPIIVVLDPDPVASGLVASLVRPGGNVTGLTSSPGPEISGKRLELLKEIVPKASRIAVLANVTLRASQVAEVQEVEGGARRLGLDLQIHEVRGPEEFDRAFEAMARQQAEAVFVLQDPVFWFQRRRLAETEARYRLPTIYSTRDFVLVGGLASYGVDLSDVARRSASYVDKILRGAKPADLPVERPTKFELVINMKTVKALGLTIPPALLLRADHMFE